MPHTMSLPLGPPSICRTKVVLASRLLDSGKWEWKESERPRVRSEGTVSSISWDYVCENSFHGASRFCSAAWYLALAVWPASGPNPHLHAFTQPNLLSLKSGRSPPPTPSCSAPPGLSPPASCSHFPLSALLRLMLALSTPSHPAQVSSCADASSAAAFSHARLSKPWSLRASPLRGHPCGLTARGWRSRARERAREPGPRPLQQL